MNNEDIFLKNDIAILNSDGTPVLLTNQIMKQLGYINPVKDEPYFIFNEFSKGSTTLRFLIYNNCCHVSIGDNDYGILFTIIKYVHELQMIEIAINRRLIKLT